MKTKRKMILCVTLGLLLSACATTAPVESSTTAMDAASTRVIQAPAQTGGFAEAFAIGFGVGLGSGLGYGIGNALTKSW